jgi:tetratricopeptide (TPR) repeat protein
VLNPPDSGSLTGDRADYDYSAVFERVAQRIRERLTAAEKERAEAGPLLAVLLATPLPERRQLVAADARYWTPAMVLRLMEEGESRPAERNELALLVLEIAPWLGDSLEIADVQAAAHCEIAEAHRRQGDLDASDTELAQAARLLGPSCDLLARAGLCHQLSSLRREQGRLDECLALMSRAADLLGEAGDAPEQAAALVEAGLLTFELSGPESALVALWRAFELGARNLSPAHLRALLKALVVCRVLSK